MYVLQIRRIIDFIKSDTHFIQFGLNDILILIINELSFGDATLICSFSKTLCKRIASCATREKLMSWTHSSQAKMENIELTALFILSPPKANAMPWVVFLFVLS